MRSTAVKMAEAQVGKAGDALGTTKARMYASVLATLPGTDKVAD
ncbi:hypothetical protein ACFYZB_41635 [Streptomyces sp. NPDC001852]